MPTTSLTPTSNRRYDLLAIDLDGTLLGPDHLVSPANARAIERAKHAGYQISICTGRGWVECRHIARIIDQTEPVIVAGGAIVTCPNTERTLHRFPINFELVNALTRCMLDHGHAVMVLKDPDATAPAQIPDSPMTRGHDYIIVSPRGESAIDPVSRWWFNQLNVSIRVVPDLSLDEHPEHTVRVGICGPRTETTAAADQIRASFGDLVQFHHFAAVAPTSDIHDPGRQILIFEAFDRNVNKWTALQWLAQTRRIETTRIVAIGNDINDLAMLQHAGLSIAMANSVPEALALAHRTTLGHDENGVAHAIDRILSGEW